MVAGAGAALHSAATGTLKIPKKTTVANRMRRANSKYTTTSAKAATSVRTSTARCTSSAK